MSTMRSLLQLTMVFVLVSHRVASAQNDTFNVDCGNTSFSGSDGVVYSPDFPLPYPHNISCTYSIDVGQNNSVLLKFLDFDLELPVAGNCTREWLMITCKDTETDDENLDFRKRYCGATLPRTSLRFFNCPVVELKFFADSSVNGGGFSIEYNVLENVTSADSIIDCGDTMFTSSSGSIPLPSNPTEYSMSVNCNYTISINLTSTFFLGIASLQLPDLLDSFEDCSTDYIMVGCVSDGETENTNNTYCRRSFDGSPFQHNRFVFTNCSALMISFRSSDYNYRGTNSIPFTVNTYDNDCGAASYTGSTGLVKSPRFPLPHAHSLNCFYSIDVDRTKTVSLHFLSFHLEESYSSTMDQCSYDWIMISCLSTGSVPPENPSPNKHYCGLHTKRMTLTYSNCDSLTLNFVTDSTVAEGGFIIQYTITSSENATTSTPAKERGTASLTGVNGFITSPRFPLSYPNNADFVYSIKVDRTKTIGLYFYSFDLEGTSHDLYNFMDNCHHDWLLISCTSTAAAVSSHYHLHRKYCGAKTTPLIRRYSYCDSMALAFVSDSSVTRGGFKIWYSISSTGQSSCGNTSFSGPNGVITSPDFPLLYPSNIRCTYSINVDRNSSVQLKLKHFNMGVPNLAGYCTHDWLKITCNETTKANPYSNRKFCGAIPWTSSLRFVDCSTLMLQFSSGSSVNREGFMIEYTVVDDSNATDDNSVLDCGTTLFPNSTGAVILPRNPTNFLATVNCTYTISTNQTSLIWLSTYFYSSMPLLQSFQDCNRENLMIGCASEGETAMNTTAARVFCRRGASAPPIPWGPLAFEDCRTVKLSIFSNTYDYRQTLRISYSAIAPNEICGNTSFSTSVGIIATPRFNFQYSKAVRCLYTIDSGQVNNSVSLIIDRLEFRSERYDRSCSNGWLTITCMVNGTAMAHPIANRKLCGSVQHPSTAKFPACQSVLFNFSSNDLSFGNGLAIRYRIGDYELDCGTTLFNSSSGYINLPINPTNYPATVNCTYTIWTNQTSTIFLNTYFHVGMSLLQSFQDCSKENLMIGCASEGQAELNPNTSRTFCHHERPSHEDESYMYDDDYDDDELFLYDGRHFRSSSSSSSSLVFHDCRALKLAIRSSTYDYRGTLRIPFSVIRPDELCGKTFFSASTGVVATPQLGFQLSRRINCQYTIDVGNVSSVVLSIDRLNFRDQYEYQYGYPYYRHFSYYGDVSCRNDWLTITCLVNGTSVAHPLAGRKLCQTSQISMTARFPACQTVVFNFSGNDFSSDNGFTVRYRIGDYELDCGSTLLSGSSGAISLPRNPTNSPATVNCTYTISTNNTGPILLNLESIRGSSQFFHSFLDCGTDSVTVGCVSEGGAELNPNTTRVFCRPSTSSNYYLPETQLVFYDCRVLKMSIRASTYDYNQYAPARFPFRTLGTDELCGNTFFSTSTGTVSSPQLRFPLSRPVSCQYTIDVGNVNSVVLSIDRLYFGYQYSSRYRDYSCSGGSLTITCLVNGTSIAHPLAGRRLCQNVQTSMAVRLPACQTVLFNFTINGIAYDKGLTMRYRIGDYELDCGNTLFNGSFGIINLPRNPTNYPATVDCTYTISTNRKDDITLDPYAVSHSLQFLQSFQDCSTDNLTIGCVSEGGTELNANTTRVLCPGSTSSYYYRPALESQLVFYDCRTLKISIHSNTYGYYPNVYATPPRLSFSVLGPHEICGNTSLSALAGIVTTQQLLVHYMKRVSCLYTIDSGHVNSVVLSIDRLYLGSTDDRNGACYNGGWLTITCLANEGGASVAHPLADRKLCGNHQPTIARFTACRSVVLNFSSEHTSYHKGITIRYRMGDYDAECGNTSFSGSTGFITSPRFPLSYPHNLNCLYSIAGGERKIITLAFPSFRLDGNSNTPSRDYCYSDWLTVSCLSDESVIANLSSMRRYCGIKTTPLTFEFPSCAAVILNFRSDSYMYVSGGGGFKVRYTVIDTDTICGVPALVRPSGVISFPSNYTDYDGSLDCNYVINATEPSSISLTISSFSLQSSVGNSCQRDWTFITCIDGQLSLNHNMTHRSCDSLNSSTQITFTGCVVAQVVFHRDLTPSGRTFRIDYTVTSYDDNVPTTELPSTSISATEPVATDQISATKYTSQTPTKSVSTESPVTRRTMMCVAGCKLSTDGTTCDCSTTQSPDTSQTPTIPASKEIPVTLGTKCEDDCKLNADGTTCDCSTVPSVNLVASKLSGHPGRNIGISLTVILLVIGAICLSAFVCLRRQRKKNLPQMLLYEEDEVQMESEDDSTKAGSIFGGHRNQDSSRFLALRSIFVWKKPSSSSSSTREIEEDIRAGL